MGWPIGWTALDGDCVEDHPGWEHDPAETGNIPRVAKGILNRVARLKAIGNGQVPQVAALAWRILTNGET